MPLIAGPWELAQLLDKILMYAGMAGASGGMLVLWLLTHGAELERRWLVTYLLCACGIGAVATALFFLLQTGAINQAGPGGMFDAALGRLLAGTAIGYATGLRLAGFVVTAVAVLAISKRLYAGTGQPLPATFLLAAATALVLFAASFAVLGHAAELPWLARVAVATHVAAVLLWIGALLPLYRLCRTNDLPALQALMRRFGQVGWLLVGCLLMAGGLVLWQLLGTPLALFDSAYGRLMLGKLLLAACLLAVAALNKFRLVPALVTQPASTLQRSIATELVLALLIFALTAALTTMTGPPHSG